jgi:hypothetical protein
MVAALPIMLAGLDAATATTINDRSEQFRPGPRHVYSNAATENRRDRAFHFDGQRHDLVQGSIELDLISLRRQLHVLAVATARCREASPILAGITPVFALRKNSGSSNEGTTPARVRVTSRAASARRCGSSDRSAASGCAHRCVWEQTPARRPSLLAWPLAMGKPAARRRA